MFECSLSFSGNHCSLNWLFKARGDANCIKRKGLFFFQKAFGELYTPLFILFHDLVHLQYFKCLYVLFFLLLWFTIVLLVIIHQWYCRGVLSQNYNINFSSLSFTIFLQYLWCLNPCVTNPISGRWKESLTLVIQLELNLQHLPPHLKDFSIIFSI